MRRTLPWLAALIILLAPAIAGADDGGSFESYQARGWGWMFLASFGFGFLTSLTPCVYPMIPITLGIFGARGDGVSKKRAIGLASAYVIGMGVTYSVLGVTVASLGVSAGPHDRFALHESDAWPPTATARSSSAAPLHGQSRTHSGQHHQL